MGNGGSTDTKCNGGNPANFEHCVNAGGDDGLDQHIFHEGNSGNEVDVDKSSRDSLSDDTDIGKFQDAMEDEDNALLHHKVPSESNGVEVTAPSENKRPTSKSNIRPDTGIARASLNTGGTKISARSIEYSSCASSESQSSHQCRLVHPSDMYHAGRDSRISDHVEFRVHIDTAGLQASVQRNEGYDRPIPASFGQSDVWQKFVAKNSTPIIYVAKPNGKIACKMKLSHGKCSPVSDSKMFHCKLSGLNIQSSGGAKSIMGAPICEAAEGVRVECINRDGLRMKGHIYACEKLTSVVGQDKKSIATLKPNQLMDVVKRTEGKKRQSHKLILMRLFSRSDQDVLESVACKYSNMAFPQRRVGRTTTDHNCTFSQSPHLEGLLPAAVLGFWRHTKVAKGQFSKAHRTGYRSLSSLELQAWAKSSFLSSVKKHPSSTKKKGRSKSNSKWQKLKALCLEYSECSVIALSTWATQLKSEETQNANSEHSNHCVFSLGGFDCTTTSVHFRKCSICGYFGHYEIECRNIGKKPNETVAIANEVRVCLNALDLNKAEREKAAVDGDYRDADTDNKRKALWTNPLCDICHSESNDLIVCDGCERLFHLCCISPPLKKIPWSEWFCNGCSQQGNFDANCDVEIEGCDGLLIEQWKRPRHCQVQENPDWQLSVSTVSKWYSDSILFRPEKRMNQTRTKQDKIDGISIIAKSKSALGETFPHMRAVSTFENGLSPNGDHSIKKTLFGRMIPGSVVAWFASSNFSTNDSNLFLGIVLAVDENSKKVLVRAIQMNCSKVLYDRGVHESGEDEYFSIHNGPACATVWKDVKSMHTVASGASLCSAEMFQEEILPARTTLKRFWCSLTSGSTKRVKNH
jgi:PHD-finger